MANLTDTWKNKIINGITGAQPPTFPSSIYLALFTANPTASGDVSSELSGLGYTRIEVTSHFPLAVGSGEVKNTSNITFPIATSNWLEVFYIGFMESNVENTADMMAYAALDVSIQILQDQAFTFNINNLIIHLDYA